MATPIRTVPPYVRSSDWEDEENPSPSSHPPHAFVRMSMTLPLVGRRISQSKRPFIGTREQDTLPHSTQYGSRWAEFMVATGAPRIQSTPEQREIAASIYGELDRRREENRNPFSEKQSQMRRRESLYRWAKMKLLKNAFVPLFFRMFVLTMSFIATGLGARIFRLVDVFNNDKTLVRFRKDSHLSPDSCKQGATTYMAVIIGALAILYTMYIAWDEFSSKPLGLRRPSSKLKLLLLDLVFVVFMAANVSLAFQAIWSDDFPCGAGEGGSCPTESHICNLQISLVVVLMVAILAWLSTFIVSLYRLVFQVEAQRGLPG